MQADIIHKALSVEDIIKRTFVGNDASFHKDSKEQLIELTKSIM